MPIVVLTARTMTAEERRRIERDADRPTVKGSMGVAESSRGLREMAPAEQGGAVAPGPAGAERMEEGA